MSNSQTEISPPNRLLKRVARISAWALLAGIIILVVSGWGITSTGIIYQASFGLIDRRLANAIHRGVNAPLAFFFLLHVLVNIKLTLLPAYSRKLWFNVLLVALGILLFMVVLFMEYFSQGVSQ